jgi:endogenous inhibitor of DNA gyrase (YacG/DUF329 family)
MVERKNDITDKAPEKRILCEICGKEFKNYKSFGDHLKLHKVTSKEYYDKFLRKDSEGICPVCGKETSYISLNRGYRKFCSNKCANSKENNPMFGKHLSEETKKKLSDANKGENNPNYGKHRSEETKKKISDANKHPSEETRKKMSDAHRGKHRSEETRKKISEAKKGGNNPNYGKHRSEETKKKISDTNKGKRRSEETKKKMSDVQKGKHLSEETRKKISDATKGENNPNYKDGNSLKEFKDAYGLEPEEWKKLAQQIRIRDKFICQYCGKKNATDVHHIIPRRIKIDNSPDNLITLCKSCHQKVEHLTDIYLAEGKDPIEIFYKKWQE